MNSIIATTSRSVLDMIDDLGTFAELPGKAQADITAKLEAVRDLITAQRGQKQTALARHTRKLGVKQSAIYRYAKHYKEKGAMGLLDERLFPRDAGLPELFKSYVKGLYDTHQREDDGLEVQRLLMDQLHLWRATGDPKYAIPGYQSPPADHPEHDHPAGWSPRNIHRLKPTKYQRKAIKIGAKEAAADLPPVLTTRHGSAYLSRILFDDQDYDNLIADGHLALSGITTASRPVSFNALDFYTATHLDNHLRIEYKDPATGKKKTLTSQEFQWFGLHILQTEGYRTDDLGTEFIGEHKTAAFWKNKQMTAFGGEHSFADAISRVTNGHVRCNVSGLFNGPLFADLYFRPQSTGNFKFKTWIESAFRLLRTYMQALPGPTGSIQRFNGPAELHGIQQREKQLLTAIAEHLDPHHASLIKHELLSVQQFAELIHAVYRALNHRTEHQLEAWHQCGFTRDLWRPSVESQHWFTNDELATISDPDERRLMI
ncbi:MAG: helix-turn-helix domain-containing protein, partial [Verrucomicrobiales bacterium]